MVHFLKLDEYIARGTTLVIVLSITIASSFFYYKNNFFDFDIALYIILGGIVGGIIGAKIMKRIPKLYLSLGFYAFMIFVAMRMIF